jgi:hypothetical protein
MLKKTGLSQICHKMSTGYQSVIHNSTQMNPWNSLEKFLCTIESNLFSFSQYDFFIAHKDRKVNSTNRKPRWVIRAEIYSRLCGCGGGPLQDGKNDAPGRKSNNQIKSNK